MNLITVSKEDFFEEDKVRLKGRRFKHIKEILKSSVSEELTVGEIDGKIGKGTVVRLTEKSVELLLVLDQNPPAPHPATLILALPRPIVLNRLLSSVTALGVKTIYLIHSLRVEKSYWNSPVLDPLKMHEQFLLGLEQSKDTVLPQVFFKKRFKPFVEDDLPALLDGRNAYAGHPSASQALPRSIKDPFLLFVGPEGGFIDYEMELLEKQGVLPVSLGPRILKVETAVPVLLSKSLF